MLDGKIAAGAGVLKNFQQLSKRFAHFNDSYSKIAINGLPRSANQCQTMPPTRPIMTANGQSPNLPLTNEPSGLKFRVAETFTSRQGEGMLTGTMSHFIRLSGCNLRCWFCDTPYASWEPEGVWQSAAAIVEGARQSGTEHVVLTGGEPLLPWRAFNWLNCCSRPECM